MGSQPSPIGSNPLIFWDHLSLPLLEYSQLALSNQGLGCPFWPFLAPPLALLFVVSLVAFKRLVPFPSLGAFVCEFFAQIYTMMMMKTSSPKISAKTVKVRVSTYWTWT